MIDNTTAYGPKEVNAAAQFLKSHLPHVPQIAIMAGTGLGEMTEAMQKQHAVAYRQIPHFPQSTVTTHAGRLVSGILGDHAMLVMQGRVHLYEGYSPKAVTLPIRVLQRLGVKTLVLTNAAGGLNPGYAAGDIMIISDHINLTGANPLVGPNVAQWGPRFPLMTAAYDPGLQQFALDEARETAVPIRQGVYAGLKGPSLETPAEMRFLRSIGADAVGFSTIMETLAAVHGDMKVLGLSVITNLCLPDAKGGAVVEEIIEIAQTTAPRLITLIQGILSREGSGRA